MQRVAPFLVGWICGGLTTVGNGEVFRHGVVAECDRWGADVEVVLVERFGVWEGSGSGEGAEECGK